MQWLVGANFDKE